jgi:hypothetical protein
MFPKIKKKISGFLLNEEGKVTKQSLVSLGSFLSAAVIGGALATKSVAADHTNSLSASYSGGVATGTHVHHSNTIVHHSNTISGVVCGSCGCGSGSGY